MFSKHFLTESVCVKYKLICHLCTVTERFTRRWAITCFGYDVMNFAVESSS